MIYLCTTYFYSVNGDGIAKMGRENPQINLLLILYFFSLSLCTVEEAAAAVAISASTTAWSQQLRPPLPQLPPSWQGKP